MKSLDSRKMITLDATWKEKGSQGNLKEKEDRALLPGGKTDNERTGEIEPRREGSLNDHFERVNYE